MNKIMLAALGASAFLIAGLVVPAAAQNQSRNHNSSGSTRAPAPDSGTSNQRICVEYQSTGSRLSRRDCRTRQEWEREGGVPTSEN